MTTKETTVRVAVVQAGAVPFDSDACVDKAVRLIEEAATTGAKVIVFPELPASVEQLSLRSVLASLHSACPRPAPGLYGCLPSVLTGDLAGVLVRVLEAVRRIQ